MWFWETQSPKFTDVILEKHHGLNKCKKPLNHIFHCEELILFFGVSRICYPLPHCVLVAKSLTVLKLHSCKLDSIRSDISLPSLKRLSLLSVYADNQIIPNLIFGCPMIENMRISCSFRERESADEAVGNQTNKKKFGFCFNGFWIRLFQSFNFVSPK